MSLAESPDRQFQSEDKALQALLPTIQDPLSDSFDDYINQALWDLTDEEKEDFFLGNVEDLFPGETLSSVTCSQSPIGRGSSARQEESSPQPWRKGLWCLNRNEPLKGPEVIAKPHYLDKGQDRPKTSSQPFHQSAAVNPRSPPLTPSKKETKKFPLFSPKAATVRQSQYCRPSISREVTLSPTPMYARLANGQTPHYETWQQDFQNFHLRARDESVPPSPPPSGRPAQNENVMTPNAVNAARIGDQMPVPNMMLPSYDVNHPMPTVEHVEPDLYVTGTDPNFLAEGPGPSMISSPLDEHVFSSSSSNYATQPQVQPAPTWPLEPVDRAHHTAEYVYRSPPQMTEGGENQGWWLSSPALSDPPARSNFAPSQIEYLPRVAAPAPQRPVHYLVSSSSADFHSGGLMIQYPPQECLAIKPKHQLALSTTKETATSTSPATSSYPPPLPQLKTDVYRQATSPSSAFPITPRRRTKEDEQGQPPARSASVSLSPTTAMNTPHSMRQSSPMRSSRRKSMGNLRPASGVSKTPRVPRTPKTPNNSNNTNGSCAITGSEMSFVNLTAADSAKLLSDVAPSGSSKTRARREQEARDKRRRLSEAAVRAIRRAGGDLASLENAIPTQ